MSGPLLGPILENLDDCRTNIMLRVQPWQGFVRVEGRSPCKTPVGLQFHAKERIRKTGEIIVVDASVNEGGREADLSPSVLLGSRQLAEAKSPLGKGQRPYLADVVFHGKFAAPQGQAGPAFVKDGMIGHRGVDVVLHASFLGGVGQGLADRDFIAPGDGVDEGSSGADKELGDELVVLQGTLDDLEVVELAKLLGYGSILLAKLGGDVGSDTVTHGAGNTGKGSTLTSGGVDDDKGSVGHEQGIELANGLAMTCSSLTVDAREEMENKNRTGFWLCRHIDQGRSR